MKTFGLVVPRSAGGKFDIQVQNLLSASSELSAIIFPLLEAWRAIRARAADLGRKVLAQARADDKCLQQRRRTVAALCAPWAQVVAVLRLRPRGSASGGRLFADPDLSPQRRRSPGMARRRPRPHRGPSRQPDRRLAPVELAGR